MEDCFINEKATQNDSVPFTINDQLQNGVARIEIIKEINNRDTFTGALMKLVNEEKTYYFLVTCAHCISKKEIEEKKQISIYYGKKGKEKYIPLNLNEEERFIKCYEEVFGLDITVIQLFNNDIKGIIDDKNFFIPDYIYKNGYNNYNNQTIYIAGYPWNDKEKDLKEGTISRGKTLMLEEKDVFRHDCNTDKGSSGSPVIWKNKIIGIHKSGSLGNYNKGTFIGPIIDDLLHLLENEDKMKLFKKNENELNIINWQFESKKILYYITNSR